MIRFLYDVYYRNMFPFLPIWAFMSLPMTNMLCFGMLRTNEDNSVKKMN